MESIREEEGCDLSEEYPDEMDAPSRNPSDELLKMAASLQEVVVGGGSASPLVKRARKLLYRRLRVGVEDGRIFVGKFHCLDKQGNIILYDTLEYRQISQGPSSSDSANASPSCMEQRSLGLVLIPARCRTSCFVECSIHEQMSLLSLNDREGEGRGKQADLLRDNTTTTWVGGLRFELTVGRLWPEKRDQNVLGEVSQEHAVLEHWCKDCEALRDAVETGCPDC